MPGKSGAGGPAVIAVALLAMAGAAYSIYSFSGMGSEQPMSAETASRSAQSATGGQGSGELREEIGNDQSPAAAALERGWVAEAEALQEQAGAFGFQRHGSPSNAAMALDNAKVSLENQFVDDPEIADRSLTERVSLTKSWLSLIRPLVAGDRDEFINAAMQLGARMPGPNDVDDDGEPAMPATARLFDKLSPIFTGAALGLTKTRARTPDMQDPRAIPRVPEMVRSQLGDRPAVMTMVEIVQNVGQDGVERTSQAQMLPLESVFPRAAMLHDQGAPTKEVVAPVRLAKSRADEPDANTSIFFVWDQEERHWTPLAMRLVLLTEEAVAAVPARPRGGN